MPWWQNYSIGWCAVSPHSLAFDVFLPFFLCPVFKKEHYTKAEITSQCCPVMAPRFLYTSVESRSSRRNVPKDSAPQFSSLKKSSECNCSRLLELFILPHLGARKGQILHKSSASEIAWELLGQYFFVWSFWSVFKLPMILVLWRRPKTMNPQPFPKRKQGCQKPSKSKH